MHTISISNKVYLGAEHYAQQNNISLNSLVEDYLKRLILIGSMQEETKATPKEELYSIQELTGMFASTKSEEELREEYIAEKYGV